MEVRSSGTERIPVQRTPSASRRPAVRTAGDNACSFLFSALRRLECPHMAKGGRTRVIPNVSFFLDKQIDAEGREDGEGHPQNSAERRPFPQRCVFPEEEDVEHEPEHCGNGKDDEQDEQIKDAFDDRLELWKFHLGLVGHLGQAVFEGGEWRRHIATARTAREKVHFTRYLYIIRRTV